MLSFFLTFEVSITHSPFNIWRLVSSVCCNVASGGSKPASEIQRTTLANMPKLIYSRVSSSY